MVSKLLPCTRKIIPPCKKRRCWYLKQWVLTAGYYQAELEDPNISEEALYEKHGSQKSHKNSQNNGKHIFQDLTISVGGKVFELVSDHKIKKPTRLGKKKKTKTVIQTVHDSWYSCWDASLLLGLEKVLEHTEKEASFMRTQNKLLCINKHAMKTYHSFTSYPQNLI